MKIAFFVPPPEQRVGGLDSAIQALRDALGSVEIPILDELPSTPDAETLVHFHGLWQPAHSRLARTCLARGTPYVVSPHGMLEPWAWRHKWWKKWPYYKLIERRYLSRARALVATATSEAGRLHHFLPRARVETLSLGLTSDARPDYENARRQLGWKPEERVLLYLSRIHVKKGLDLLLHALARTPRLEPTRLVVVGDGEPAYVRTLQDFARQHATNLPPIEWKGAIWGAARWPYFQGADLFCLPTHSENFGLAVLEACQVGTPALTTTETPWGTELSSSRGFISKPKVESIRQSLADYFQQPRWNTEKRTSLADWAHANFDWKALALRYAAFYRSILSPS